MRSMGKYIYGIMNSGEELSFDPYATPSLSSVTFAKETSMWPSKVALSNKVYTISYQDISAVVSDSEIIDCTNLCKDSLAKLLLWHQIIIEGIMNLKYAIIPARIGTFAIDENEVEDVLNKEYSVIKNIVRKIEDKIEIDVVAIWGDLNSVIKEVGEEKEIKEYKEKLLAKSEGINVDDQMKIGCMIKNHLDKRRKKYSFDIQTFLSEVSEDIKTYELMDDSMVANSAFLINKIRQKDFDRKVEELNIKFAGKLYFRCVGPLPPYSFYTVEIKKIKFSEIDCARKKLGLHNFATKNEIKRAYNKSVFSCHPDQNPDKPGAKEEFDNLTKAYKMLVDYCLAAKKTGQRDGYSFEEKEFKKNSILIKVRD